MAYEQQLLQLSKKFQNFSNNFKNRKLRKLNLPYLNNIQHMSTRIHLVSQP